MSLKQTVGIRISDAYVEA